MKRRRQGLVGVVLLLLLAPLLLPRPAPSRDFTLAGIRLREQRSEERARPEADLAATPGKAMERRYP